MRAKKSSRAYSMAVSSVIELRMKVGFSQFAFADLIAIPRRTFQEWE